MVLNSILTEYIDIFIFVVQSYNMTRSPAPSSVASFGTLNGDSEVYIAKQQSIEYTRGATNIIWTFEIIKAYLTTHFIATNMSF